MENKNLKREELIKKLSAKKNELEQQSKRCCYKTNQILKINDPSIEKGFIRINIATKEELIKGFAYLINYFHNIANAINSLTNSDNYKDFTYLGYTYEEWVSDIQMKFDIIKIRDLISELNEEIKFLDNKIDKDYKEEQIEDSIFKKYENI